jgi:hypothetical protein
MPKEDVSAFRFPKANPTWQRKEIEIQPDTMKIPLQNSPMIGLTPLGSIIC